MKYKVLLLKRAEKDVLRLKKAGEKIAVSKIDALIEELELHPRTGTGKPERLKHVKNERWSRRITDKHRLVYDIFENTITVEILQTYGHYDDK